MTSAAQETSGAGWPDFLTVEQAAEIVRIGRTSAYALAREYLATGGAEGLPVIRIGKQLRVPRAQLERWHGGPFTPRSRRQRSHRSRQLVRRVRGRVGRLVPCSRRCRSAPEVGRGAPLVLVYSGFGRQTGAHWRRCVIARVTTSYASASAASAAYYTDVRPQRWPLTTDAVGEIPAPGVASRPAGSA